MSYSAAIESAATRDTDPQLSDFTRRVEREANRRCCRDTQRLVVIGDGAPWIWNLAGELFPQVIQIVDRFHVKEYLSQVAKSIYGETGDEAKRWAERRHQELDEGRWKSLLTALLRHALHSKAARDCLQYLQRCFMFNDVIQAAVEAVFLGYRKPASQQIPHRTLIESLPVQAKFAPR